jgi:hypothetical protein
LRVSGNIPPEVWNRLGTRFIPKLKSGSDLQLLFNAKLTVDASTALLLKKDLEQALADLGLSDRLGVDIECSGDSAIAPLETQALAEVS